MDVFSAHPVLSLCYRSSLIEGIIFCLRHLGKLCPLSVLFLLTFSRRYIQSFRRVKHDDDQCWDCTSNATLWYFLRKRAGMSCGWPIAAYSDHACDVAWFLRRSDNFFRIKIAHPFWGLEIPNSAHRVAISHASPPRHDCDPTSPKPARVIVSHWEESTIMVNAQTLTNTYDSENYLRASCTL